jgi:hypothetical protein
LGPSRLLVVAHILITKVLNISPLTPRLASVAIPILFGFSTSAMHKVSTKGALMPGPLTATVSALAMPAVTGLHDHVPILPEVWIEWCESPNMARAFSSPLSPQYPRRSDLLSDAAPFCHTPANPTRSPRRPQVCSAKMSATTGCAAEFGRSRTRYTRRDRWLA